MLRNHKSSALSLAVTMALTVALGACTEGDGTGVDVEDVTFDAEASAADLQVVQSAFSASMFEALNAASPNFNLVPGGAAPAPGLIQAGWSAATSSTRWEAEAVARSLAESPALGTLLHDDLRGRTYDRDGGDYRHNDDRTDAPADGVRFILYEVDPVTGEPGDTEIGYVDIIDESTDLAYVARVIVVTGGVEHINYTVSVGEGTESVRFEVVGFISDGTDRVDVDLSMSFVNEEGVSTATVDQLIAVPSRDFEVDATTVAEFHHETEQGSITVDAAFMQGVHTVTVSALIEFGEGDGDDGTDSGTVEIRVDGLLFAVVTVDGDTVTVQDASGGELTAREAGAVRNIFDALEDLFDDKFEDFIRPVNWLFDRQ